MISSAGGQGHAWTAYKGLVLTGVFVTLTLSLSLLRCACKAREISFSMAAFFAAGEKVRMRGGRRRAMIHPLAGGNTRLLLPAKVLDELA